MDHWNAQLFATASVAAVAVAGLSVFSRAKIPGRAATALWSVAVPSAAISSTL